MPRMSYVGSESFRRGEQHHSPENQNFDFCRDCWDTVICDPRAAMSAPPNISDRWIEADPIGEDHPDYEDDDYECHCCGKRLTGRDDYAD